METDNGRLTDEAYKAQADICLNCPYPKLKCERGPCTYFCEQWEKYKNSVKENESEKT